MKQLNVTCPDCGSKLDIQMNIESEEPYHTGYHVKGQPLPTRPIFHRAVVFCTGCEFVHVITEV